MDIRPVGGPRTIFRLRGGASSTTLWRVTIWLDSRAGRLAAAAVAVALAAGMMFFAARRGIADRMMRAPGPERWEQAIRLEPASARYYHRLGRYWELNPLEPEPERAAEYYQRAVEINPLYTDAWLRLGIVRESLGETAAAEAAFHAARRTYPLSAEVAWQYGNFLVRQRRTGEGFAELRRGIEARGELLQPALALGWRVERDAERLLEALVPRETEPLRTALRFFTDQADSAAARAAWARLVHLAQPVPRTAANRLLNLLLSERRVAEAAEVWEQQLRLAGEEALLEREGSLVVDGGFEHGATWGVFGWRWNAAEGAAFSIVSDPAHSGSRAAEIRFDGTANLRLRHFFQLVPAEPSTRYAFEAFVRTESLSTDQGVRFVVYDAWDGARVHAETETLTGSQPWAHLRAELTTSPATGLLRIELRREPSRKFDSKLRGTVWVDDVALRPSSEARR
jgi:tetratricopeptide (TPR) repeat protein